MLSLLRYLIVFCPIYTRINILLPYCCNNKQQQVQWLQTIQIYCVWVLKSQQSKISPIVLKPRCQQVNGRIHFLAFSNWQRLSAFLGTGSPYVSSKSSVYHLHILFWVWHSCLSTAFVITLHPWTIQDNLQSQHP